MSSQSSETSDILVRPGVIRTTRPAGALGIKDGRPEGGTVGESNGIVHRVVVGKGGVGSNVDGWVHGGGDD